MCIRDRTYTVSGGALNSTQSNLSTCVSVWLFECHYIYLSLCICIYQYVCLCVFLYVIFSVYLSVNLCQYITVCLYVSSIVSESGASIYSASEAAQRELPIYDVSLRGAGMICVYHQIIKLSVLYQLATTNTVRQWVTLSFLNTKVLHQTLNSTAKLRC